MQDIILPHEQSFYDLIVSKVGTVQQKRANKRPVQGALQAVQHAHEGAVRTQARGKSGPLFSFDVHEDVRIQNDASLETDNSHAGKVVERHWYSR